MRGSPSAMQQMTFESSVKFLREAAVRRDLDMLGSVSSRIAAGRPVRAGTGASDALIDLDVVGQVTERTFGRFL
jgi:DNA-directed RNA polymerase I subunit RPA1